MRSKFELQIRGEKLDRVDSYDHIRTYTRSIVQYTSFKNNAYIALRPLVSLFGRLVACSARIVVRDRQTDRQTHTRDNYPSLRMRAEG